MNKCNQPKWQPEFWKKIPEKWIKNTNCYSYVMDQLNTGKYYEGKVQPGTLKNESNKYEFYDCNEIINKVKEDYNWYSILPCTLTDSLPCNRYRIALVIDNEGEHTDYHFYRQDNNGKWSHKLGKNPVTNIDSCNKKISDPSKACRNYDKKKNDKYNYEIFCGYYSVPYENLKII